MASNFFQASTDWPNDGFPSPISSNFDHRQPRTVQKQMYRNSPTYHDSPAHQQSAQKKPREDYNHVDRPPQAAYKPSSYDRFPSPFDHMMRPPPSGGFPTGVEVPPASKPEVNHSNGPKSYGRPSGSIHSAKHKGEQKIENRRSYLPSHNPAADAAMQSESKKSSFLIDNITKSTTLLENVGSTPENANRLGYLKPPVPHDMIDHPGMVLGVDPSRMPSFHPELFNLPVSTAVLEAQSRLSASSKLSISPSWYYSRSPEVAYPFLYQPTSYVSSSLPLHSNAGQANPKQQERLLSQTLRNPVPSSSTEAFVKSTVSDQTRFTSSTSNPVDCSNKESRMCGGETAKQPTEVKQTLGKENSSTDLIYSAATKSSISPYITPSNPGVVDSSYELDTTPGYSPWHRSHLNQTTTISQRDRFEEINFKDIDMRKIAVQENKDTDLRPFLTRGAHAVLPEPRPTQRTPQSQMKERSRPPSLSNLSQAASSEPLTSSSNQNHVKTKATEKLAKHLSSKNQAKTKLHSGVSKDDNSAAPQKRKYNKIKAPVAHITAGHTSEKKQPEKPNQSENVKSATKVKEKNSKCGRKRKHPISGIKDFFFSAK